MSREELTVSRALAWVLAGFAWVASWPVMIVVPGLHPPDLHIRTMALIALAIAAIVFFVAWTLFALIADAVLFVYSLIPRDQRVTPPSIDGAILNEPAAGMQTPLMAADSMHTQAQRRLPLHTVLHAQVKDLVSTERDWRVAYDALTAFAVTGSAQHNSEHVLLEILVVQLKAGLDKDSESKMLYSDRASSLLRQCAQPAALDAPLLEVLFSTSHPEP